MRSQIVQRTTYSVGEDNILTYEIESTLAKLMEVEIGIINDQIFLVEQLKRHTHFDPLKIFLKLDTMNKEYLDEQT